MESASQVEPGRNERGSMPITEKDVEDMRKKLEDARTRGEEKKRKIEEEFNSVGLATTKRLKEVNDTKQKCKELDEKLKELERRETELDATLHRYKGIMLQKEEKCIDLTEKLRCLKQNVSASEVKKVALKYAYDCRPRQKIVLDVSPELKDMCSERESLIVLQTMKEVMAKMEETAKGMTGIPAFKFFGSDGINFFPTPAESWKKEDLGKEIGLIYEGKSYVVIPISRNGMTLHESGHNLITRACEMLVKELLKYGVERFYEFDDVHFVFWTFTENVNLAGRGLMNDLARKMLNYAVPEDLKFMMTPKGLKQFSYAKKVTVGLEEFLEKTLKDQFNDEGYLFTDADTKKKAVDKIATTAMAMFLRLGKANKVFRVARQTVLELKKKLPDCEYRGENLRHLYRLAKNFNPLIPLTMEMKKLVFDCKRLPVADNTDERGRRIVATRTDVPVVELIGDDEVEEPVPERTRGENEFPKIDEEAEMAFERMVQGD